MTDIAEAHSSFAADDERETVRRIVAGRSIGVRTADAPT